MSWHCKRCDVHYQDKPEQVLGPRDEYGRILFPCCEPQAASFTVETNFRKAGPSEQAAKGAAESARMSDIHRHIYRALLEQPRTPDEIHALLNPIHGLVLNTYRARITDLSNAGWITDTGDRRATEAGRPATVWAVSERKAA